MNKFTSGLTRDLHVTGVLRSCNNYSIWTASFPPVADTQRCRNDHPQCCLIAVGLRQRTTSRHVCHQPQQASSGTEDTGQGGVSSPAFGKRHGITQTTTLVLPTKNIQDTM